MKHLFAAAAVAAALSSFAAQKTTVSVAEPYLFTDETAEISGLPDGETTYSAVFTDARTGVTTTSSGKVSVTGGRASVEPVWEGLHALSFPGVPRPVRFLAFAPPPSVDAATLRRELPRAAEKLLGGKECRLLFLGDSVTATGEYGKILAKMLARAAGNGSVVAEKRAHSGCSIDASVRDFMKEAGETRPDVVFTMYGLNDSAAGMSRAIFVRQLAWLRNHALDDFGAESVFVMPTPDHSDQTYRVREFDQAVADAAEALGVPYVDGFAAIGTNDFSRTYLYPPSYSAQFETHAAIGMEKGDRIHPNALGHLRLARAAFAARRSVEAAEDHCRRRDRQDRLAVRTQRVVPSHREGGRVRRGDIRRRTVRRRRVHGVLRPAPGRRAEHGRQVLLEGRQGTRRADFDEDDGSVLDLGRGSPRR